MHFSPLNGIPTAIATNFILFYLTPFLRLHISSSQLWGSDDIYTPFVYLLGHPPIICGWAAMHAFSQQVINQ
jgi:hypothetical protein